MNGERVYVSGEKWMSRGYIQDELRMKGISSTRFSLEKEGLVGEEGLVKFRVRIPMKNWWISCS